jgi:hypothetical protein
MSKTRYRRYEGHELSDDIFKCYKVFDAICEENGVEAFSEECDRIAAIVIEFFQQGIRDEEQLRTLVQATRGFVKPPE